jgi:predicted transcriptional regulator of viral defense system
MNELAKYMNIKQNYIRLKEIKRKHFNTYNVKKLLSEGYLEKVKPGLYRSSELPDPKNISLSYVDVAKAAPDSVICLLSALSYYDLTTFNSPEINIAIPRGHKVPTEINQPVKVYYFSEKTYNTGISTIQTIYGPVKIYDIEKSICDIFRYRDKIGEDIAYESLRNYVRNKNADFAKLIKYAKICRIYPIINLSLKALVG